MFRSQTTSSDMRNNRNDVDVESQEEYLPAFSDPDTRRNFVSKVYLILTIQLAFTALCIFLMLCTEQGHEFAYDYFWVGIIFLVLGLIFYIVLACSSCSRHNFPLNIILVAILTFCYSVACAFLSARYSITVVGLAFGCTALITILISLLARFVCDVTGWMPILYIAFLALSVFGLVASIVSFFIFLPILHIIYSAIAVVLLSVYLLIMTQMILGGRKGEIQEDEVILAVIILYVTIIDIFLHLLRLIGACFEE